MELRPLFLRGVALASMAALSCVAVPNATAAGPNPTLAKVNECMSGTHPVKHRVSEGSDGRFTVYKLAGGHQFDATGVYLNGYDSRGNFVNWPVAIKSAGSGQRFFTFKKGVLRDKVINGKLQRYNYHKITVPSGLSEANFVMRFSVADPNRQIYMKLIDPRGNSAFYNATYGNSESARIVNPAAGEWTVRTSIQPGLGKDVGYTLAVGNRIESKTENTSGCWRGGIIKGAWNEYSPGVTWANPYHQAAGMRVEMDNFLIEDVSILGQGDGFQITGDNTIIKGAYLADIHDDCVENDKLGNMLITDSFFDGCYVAFSARTQGSYIGLDGSDNLFEIRDSLVRLEEQPSVYDPGKYGYVRGHGPFFKWMEDKNKAMKLSLHNTIFFAAEAGLHGGSTGPGGVRYNLGLEEIKNLESCSNNIMVWAGPSGKFPNQRELEATGCFTIVEDYSVWGDAVAAWRARHPGRPRHP